MFFGRGKNKIQNPYTIANFYKDYVKDKDKKSPYHVSNDIYRNILESYYKEIRNHILEKGLTFKFPCNLGEFKIVKKKIDFSKSMQKRNVDWANTLKYGKKVYYVNEHTGGYKYLYMWDKAKGKLKNISKYKFVPTRCNKRKLASYIKNRIRDYFEV